MSRFDLIVLTVLLALCVAIMALAWRGDQVGVQVVRVSPPDGAAGVSTKAS